MALEDTHKFSIDVGTGATQSFAMNDKMPFLSQEVPLYLKWCAPPPPQYKMLPMALKISHDFGFLIFLKLKTRLMKDGWTEIFERCYFI